LLVAGLACADIEGNTPGECTDGADNDADGYFDCQDSDCYGSPDCVGDDDAGDDDGGDDDGGDDDGGDDDTVDCDNLPAAPISYTVMNGPVATEDFAFDDQGNMIGSDWGGTIFKSPYQGQPQLFLPNAGQFVSGLRMLPTGDFVYSEVYSGTLFRVTPAGDKIPVLSGLAYGNGLEVDEDGYVYVAEQDGGRIRKIDPYTGDFEMLVTGLYNPNGVTFSPDYRTLYIGSFGGGTIEQLEILPNGDPGALTMLIDDLGNHQLDGMGVDACGNVYVCEYIAARVWRISPDGQVAEPVVMLGGETEWIPNMQWGSGYGGWDPMKLYVQNIDESEMFEVDIGVPSKFRSFP
jgi:hypothetical protein